jgi:cytoskeletal protein CcmA (bactofilin family)
MLNTLSKNPNEKPCNTIDTLIGAKTEIKGDISFAGGLRIDGKIKGNVTATGEGNSTLVLSEHAVIQGNVTVPHIISNGQIKGDVRASERVELQVKAEIEGDVFYKTIEMAQGAIINGNLTREVDDAAREKASVTRLKTVSTDQAPPEG